MIIRQYRRWRAHVLFLVLFAALYSCSSKSSQPEQTVQSSHAAASDSGLSDDTYRPFEDTPGEFDTTASVGNTTYRLHVVYRSLNDNAVHQRVWYGTSRGADTPGVFTTSNREIAISAYNGPQQLFQKTLRKEQLLAGDSTMPAANLVLGEPEFEGVEGGEFVFGVGIAEADTDEGDWLEFSLTPSGQLHLRGRSSLEE